MTRQSAGPSIRDELRRLNHFRLATPRRRVDAALDPLPPKTRRCGRRSSNARPPPARSRHDEDARGNGRAQGRRAPTIAAARGATLRSARNRGAGSRRPRELDVAKFRRASAPSPTSLRSRRRRVEASSRPKGVASKARPPTWRSPSSRCALPSASPDPRIGHCDEAVAQLQRCPHPADRRRQRSGRRHRIAGGLQLGSDSKRSTRPCTAWTFPVTLRRSDVL